MTKTRQDAWSEDDDLVLAEVVLRHIREGSTQLKAFEEVGERLSRTPAACGFRWNSLVRKKYESAIEIAKKQRKKLKAESDPSAVKPQKIDHEGSEKTNVNEDPLKGVEEKGSKVNTTSSQPALSLHDVIVYLKKFREEANEQERLIQENESLKKSIAVLKKENETLAKKLERLEKEHRTVYEDYRALVAIMERASRFKEEHGRRSDDKTRSAEA